MITIKRAIIIILSFLLIFMSGCQVSSNPIGNIVSPVNRLSPLEGIWEISDMQNSSRDTAQFSADAVLLYGAGYGNINYIVKKVKLQEYFLFNKYKITGEKLGIRDEEVYIVTLTSSNTLIGDFIKLDGNNAIAFINDNIHWMKKTSDEINDKIFEAIDNSESRIGILKKQDIVKSGALLGLKSFNEKNDNYEYRTLWISSNSNSPGNVEEIKDLLFPRKIGFWRLTSQRVTDGHLSEDVLVAYDLSRKDEALTAPPDINLEASQERIGRIYKNIMYLCNDFVSVETEGSGIYGGSDEKWRENKLQLIPINSIVSSKGVKISEVSGTNGLRELKAGKNSLLSSLGEVIELGKNSEEENFGLVRKTGQWILRGRVNFERNNEITYADYNINIIPPEKLVFYDTLNISWNSIKNKVPDAQDAYTSPNGDIALILTKSKLYVYGITNGKLDAAPSNKIDLREGETVVMAEWSTGNYVDNWNNIIVKTKANDNKKK